MYARQCLYMSSVFPLYDVDCPIVAREGSGACWAGVGWFDHVVKVAGEKSMPTSLAT